MKQIGQPELGLQIHQQVYDLRLNRNVERRHRFIRDDQLGLECEHARDGDALSLATGKLVRVAARHLGLQAHLAQHVA